MGGIFSDGTPVLGRGTPGCGGRRGTEWHSRMRKSALQAGNPVWPGAWPSGVLIPKVLEAVGGDAYDAPPFFWGWLDSSVGRATD